MIIVKTFGGLGNQMFHYALAKNLAIKHNTELKFDISWFGNINNSNNRPFALDIFNINIIKASQKDHSELIYITREPEAYAPFLPEVLSVPDQDFIVGNWQSEKYFIDIKEVIKKDFLLEIKISDNYFNKILDKIISENSVSIHIRRGDYKNHPVLGLYTETDYFINAMDIISTKVENPHFFIFSDDINWCKKNFSNIANSTVVDNNHLYMPYKYDLFLISKCKHNIIPNSTFSWWGAWLNNNENKIVLAPKMWTNQCLSNDIDIIPENWIQI